MHKRRLLVLILVLASALSLAVIVHAQDGDPPPADEVTADEVNAVANQLYCPVCENIPLDVCGTKACADWRDEIRVMLEEGRSEDDIKNYFVERYGKRVLATPDVTGIDIVVWVAPVIAVLIGIAVVIGTLMRMAPEMLSETVTRDVVRAAPVHPRTDGSYVQRVEAELREYIGES